MVDTRTRSAVRAIVQRILAASCACSEEDLLAEGVTIVVARALPGRLRYPLPSRAMQVVTMGEGVVVSCHLARLAWARAALAPLDRDQIFAPSTIARLARYVEGDRQELRGPDLKFVCSADSFRPADVPEGVSLALAEDEAVTALYRYPGFSHALAYRVHPERPDRLAAVASVGETIVGVAAASADDEALWQIGVDVGVDHQNRGIGRALVGRLTEALLARGIVPYYSASVANLRSRALALNLGYWPAWTELYAKDRDGKRAT